MGRKKTKKDEILDPNLLRIFDSGLTKGQMTKARIIEAAINIFATKGLDGLSLEKLGKLVGISKSHVLYHYPNRDLLFKKSIEYITNTAQSFVINELKEASSPSARLEAYIEGNFAWAISHPEQARTFILFIANCQYSEELAEFHAQIRKASLARIEAILAEIGHRESQKRSRLAQSVLDLVTGSILEIMTTGGSSLSSVLKARADWVKQSCTSLVSI